MIPNYLDVGDSSFFWVPLDENWVKINYDCFVVEHGGRLYSKLGQGPSTKSSGPLDLYILGKVDHVADMP
jgi:hypothetical protein